MQGTFTRSEMEVGKLFEKNGKCAWINTDCLFCSGCLSLLFLMSSSINLYWKSMIRTQSSLTIRIFVANLFQTHELRPSHAASSAKSQPSNLAFL